MQIRTESEASKGPEGVSKIASQFYKAGRAVGLFYLDTFRCQGNCFATPPGLAKQFTKWLSLRSKQLLRTPYGFAKQSQRLLRYPPKCNLDKCYPSGFAKQFTKWCFCSDCAKRITLQPLGWRVASLPKGCFATPQPKGWVCEASNCFATKGPFGSEATRGLLRYPSPITSRGQGNCFATPTDLRSKHEVHCFANPYGERSNLNRFAIL